MATGTNPGKNTPLLPFIVLGMALLPVLMSPYLKRRGAGMMSGKEAPEILFADRVGNPAKLSDSRGNVVLLNFWASWCGPCMSEMAALQTLEERLGPEGFKILAVNIEEKPADIKTVLEQKDLPKNLYFLREISGADAYKVSALPMTYLIDREGKIQRKYQGSLDWTSPSVEAEIRPFLKRE